MLKMNFCQGYYQVGVKWIQWSVKLC